MTGKQVSDEGILNVFRMSSRPFLRTADVVDQGPIKRRGVQKRLNKLEQEGRIEYEEVGQAHVWWLAENEPTKPVGESGARLLRISSWCDWLANGTKVYTGICFGGASFLMVLYLFIAEIPDSAIPLLTKQKVVEIALSAALLGSLFAVSWAVFQLAGFLLPKLAARRKSN
ncbi:hypothetical protein [Halorubellus salinus]|uniref:hypothetical protein n=1 Tax=Halorubellus salinus TaxID=755309 RepID=UPI001D06B535|nr:hypothetical protein [Halorubellus salinus]